MAAASVWGGSATLATAAPVRLIEVRLARPVALTLQLDLTTAVVADGVTVTVTTGASQTSQTRTYRCQAGRFVAPVIGDFVTVDVAWQGTLTPPVRIIGMLAEQPSAQAPLGSTTGNGQTFSVPALGSVTVPAVAGSLRILRNDGAGDMAISIDGITAYVLVGGETREIPYVGEFVASALVGGDLRVITLHA